jgi:hypothetical protein
MGNRKIKEEEKEKKRLGWASLGVSDRAMLSESITEQNR